MAFGCDTRQNMYVLECTGVARHGDRRSFRAIWDEKPMGHKERVATLLGKTVEQLDQEFACGVRPIRQVIGWQS